MELKIGDKAPEFSALTENNQTISLKDFLGKKLVLYFYPKDMTPGCTLESCGFRDHIEKFQAHNTQVLGVSRDSVESHLKFTTKHQLPFPLLADVDGTICKVYGVLQEKSMFGKKYLGSVRSTFLIDERGRLQQMWPKVNAIGHVQTVLKSIS